MDSKIVDKIKKHSDSYSFELWNRFLENKLNTPDEKEIFSAIQKWASESGFNGPAESEKELASYFGKHSLHCLPLFFVQALQQVFL